MAHRFRRPARRRRHGRPLASAQRLPPRDGPGWNRHVGGSARRAPRDLRDPRTAAADVARSRGSSGRSGSTAWPSGTDGRASPRCGSSSRTSCSPRSAGRSASIPSVGVLHETGWMITHEPDILMAWVGFGLLVAVAITSVRIARRKLRRETWYFVHLYAYLADRARPSRTNSRSAATSSGDRAARIWWIRLYVIVVGAIVRWRVIEPIRFNLRHALRVAVREARSTGRRLRSTSPAGTSIASTLSRASSSCGASSPGAMVEAASVLALGRARTAGPAHHRQGPRRPQRARCSSSSPGHACSPKVPYGTFTAGTAHPAARAC